MKLSRRMLLNAMLGAAAAVPLSSSLARRALASPLAGAGKAKRLIVFYFPDGIPQPDGAPSRWHMSGSDTTFDLVDTLSPLSPYRSRCIFFNGLTMGPTDAGSHPGGAKKLLTAFDGGNGPSIDQRLARTVGASAPFPVVVLGAAATSNNASGDKFISYAGAGAPVAPEDDPRKAFQRLFGGATPSPGSGGSGAADDGTRSVLDANLADLDELRARLGDVEKSKLDLHMEALRDLEKRLQGGAGGTAPSPATCGQPQLDASGFGATELFEPAKFPAVLRAQMDVMVQAMACGLTRVGVLQASQHTSELIMSRFAGAEMYDAGADMRSHQASHYGQPSDAKYDAYVKQRRWFVSQLAYLLGQLAARPEDGGTMLDHSLVLLCSEIADGNTHRHDDMPFILAGGGGGSVRTGRLLDAASRRHADLYVAIAQAIGDPMTTFGDTCGGVLPGVLA